MDAITTTTSTCQDVVMVSCFVRPGHSTQLNSCSLSTDEQSLCLDGWRIINRMLQRYKPKSPQRAPKYHWQVPNTLVNVDLPSIAPINKIKAITHRTMSKGEPELTSTSQDYFFEELPLRLMRRVIFHSTFLYSS